MDSLFFDVHSDLPREGPGSAASARRALAAARPHLPTAPRVVEAACGPGAALPVLREELPGASILAFDLHAPFVEQARALDLPGVEARVDDMATFAPDRPVDLVWCEGAAYFLGFPTALERFRSWLAPGGLLVASEAVWLVEDRPERAVACWEEYPAMTDVAGVRQQVADAGLELIDSFVLPPDDWEAYYGPVQDRLDGLRARLAGDEAALAELAVYQEEIDTFRACSEAYSYLMVVARRPSMG